MRKKYPSALLHHIKHANALVKRNFFPHQKVVAILMPQRTQDEGIELLHPAFSEYTSNGIPLVSLSMETC